MDPPFVLNPIDIVAYFKNGANYDWTATAEGMEARMNRLNVRTIDPIFVEASTDAKHAVLRIGEARRGEPRYAVLDPGELRTLAYMLLIAAEDIQAQIPAKA